MSCTWDLRATHECPHYCVKLCSHLLRVRHCYWSYSSYLYLLHVATQFRIWWFVHSVPVYRHFDLFIELEDNQGI